ncbi:PH domain-containing protein [Gallaecimonas sp. GXIMD4217]|uniref:PH domain-containing protein n=1 Tax=Gallaecimonas sp. GXIMD4217 TaxID=3131927 RepID=UPI00311AEA23
MAWQRLSPWGLGVVFLGQLRLMVQALPGFIAAGLYGPWDLGTLGLWGLSAGLPLMLASSILGWWLFRFRLDGNRLLIRKGLLFRAHLDIPASRIQNIQISQPLYLRPLSLYNLEVETAGAKGKEATLVALPLDQANRLKRQLLEGATAPVQQEASAPMLSRSLGDLVIHGICHNHLAWLLVVLAPFWDYIDWSGMTIFRLDDSRFSPAMTALAVAGFLLALFLVFTLLSVLGAVVRYHPYALHRHDGMLRLSGGLLTRHQASLKLRRLQIIRLRYNLLCRLFGRWTLELVQVKDDHQQEQDARASMVLPALEYQQLPHYMSLLGHRHQVPEEARAIDSRYLSRTALLWLLPALPTLATLMQITGGSQPLLLLPLLWLLVWLRWRHWGYHQEGRDLWIRSGLFGTTWTLIPGPKVQAVRLSQSPGQMKHDLASLQLSLASGTLTLPYIPLRVAQQIRDRLIYEAERHPHDWL